MPLLEHVAEQHHEQPHQKHGHAQLIDEVHGAQVEIGMAVRIVLAEEVTEHRTEIKQIFQHDTGAFWYARITLRAGK
jgi:hypothetical protein